MPLSKENMETVNKLVKAGHIDAARTLLESLDGPKAEAALAKLNERYPVEKRKVMPVAMLSYQPSFTGKLFVTIVLLFFFTIPGLIALSIFAPEAKRYPDAPGAGALILLNKSIFWIIVISLILLSTVVLIPVFTAYQNIGR